LRSFTLRSLAMPDAARRIRENVAAIRARIAAAAGRSGRAAEAVTLVAVTKFVGEPEIRALVAAGCTILGESRPQHLWDKAPRLAGLPIRWHLIGHLQRNKVRRTLPLVEMIESVDSLELVVAMDRHAAEIGRRVPILLEVNVAGEPAKHGFDAPSIARQLPDLGKLAHIDVRGLMCMASLEGGPDVARRDFARLRELRDGLRPQCPDSVRLEELSMGMSGDFEVAIEEGATIVRIGSALFEGVTQ
jgi:pyridoxal phosphate enzyme (YggS family)